MFETIKKIVQDYIEVNGDMVAYVELAKLKELAEEHQRIINIVFDTTLSDEKKVRDTKCTLYGMGLKSNG